MKQSHKATRQQLKRHNRQLLLRKIYEQPGSSRATLSEETGLAKPTVSDIVGEFLQQGLVMEMGQGISTAGGGKRPTLLRFVPEAQQVIGITVSDAAITGCLSNLDARPLAYHEIALAQFPLGVGLQIVINALIAQSSAPLCCIGVGVPGSLDATPSQPNADQVLRVALAERYGIPVHVSHNTLLAARARLVYDTTWNPETLAVVLVNHAVEVGIAFEKSYQHGSDLRSLTLPQPQQIAALSDLQVRQRIAALPASGAVAGSPYLLLRHGWVAQQPEAMQMLRELAALLGQVYAWIIALVRPNEIVLAGQISDLGEVLLDEVRRWLRTALPDNLIEAVRFSLADRQQLMLHGAVVSALHDELGLF